MKYLIIGRTGSGKDYYADIMEKEFGLKILKSYTTRKQRDENDNGHIFITPEEASTITDRIAEWKLDNGIEYFATKQQFNENDIYIINPKAAIDLLSKLTEDEIEKLHILYIFAYSRRKRFKALKRRCGNDEIELKRIKKRDLAENIEFCKFEQILSCKGSIMIKDFCNPLISNTIYNKIIIYRNEYVEYQKQHFIHCMLEFGTNSGYGMGVSFKLLYEE